MGQHFGQVTPTSLYRLVAAALLVLLLPTVIGCSGQPLSTREKGTLVGAGGGAAVGAIIGAAVGNPGAGAAIGGGLGLLGGALIGNAMQNQEVQQAQTQSQISQQQREIERQRYEIERLKQQQEAQSE
jgi:outer membrane lipoprotein SlyB